MAQEMEHTVHEQSRHLVVETPSSPTRLMSSAAHADHDVAQELVAVASIPALTQGEGQHVRGPAPAAVALVQLGHLGVIQQCDGELRVLLLEPREEAARAPPQQPQVRRPEETTMRGPGDPDLHPWVSDSSLRASSRRRPSLS